MTAALPVSPSPAAVAVTPPSTGLLAAGLPSLVEYLRRVPDPRGPQGKRHPLEAILLLVVVATLAGRKHRLGMAEWARHADAGLRRR